jgi:hypothetical protein
MRRAVSGKRLLGLRPGGGSWLHHPVAGWTVGDVAVHGESGLVWIVSGANGENRIEALGVSQDEAWHNAVLQAEAVGVARPRRSLS